MKKEPPPPPGPPRPYPVTDADRARWMAEAMERDDWPDEAWFDRIKAEKPGKIVTDSHGEFMAICHLCNQGVMRSSGFAVGKTNGQYVWSVYYPQPKQENLL